MNDRKAIGDSIGRRTSPARGLGAVTLLLLIITAPFATALAEENSELREALRNMVYPSDWTRSGQASLIGGVYEEPAAPGSTSKVTIRFTDFVAVGAIDGQAVAALVLVTDPGGSGVFFDLYLVSQREHPWHVVNRAHLGDRIRVHAIEVARGLIALDVTAHGPRDGICCPTERATVRYGLQDGRLVKVSTSAQTTSGPIEDQVWAWQQTVRGDGTKTTPIEPTYYTLRFGPEWNLHVRADCNQAGGRYRLEGSRLILTVTHSTMAACPPESMDRLFLTDLAAVNGWRLVDGGLHLDLAEDGTMVFTAGVR